LDNGITSNGVNEKHVTLRYARVIALTFIPADASRSEARAWLNTQVTQLTSEDRDFICDVHIEDDVLRSWRVNS